MALILTNSKNKSYGSYYNAQANLTVFNDVYNGELNNLGWLVSGSSSWIQVDLGWEHTIGAYALGHVGAAVVNRAVKNWTVQVSNNGNFSGEQSVWDTQENITGWSSTDEKSFAPGDPITGRYVRFVVTANNGDAYTGIGWVKLFGGDGKVINPRIPTPVILSTMPAALTRGFR